MTTKKFFLLLVFTVSIFLYILVSCDSSSSKPFTVSKDYTSFMCTVAGKRRSGTLYIPQKLRTKASTAVPIDLPAIIIVLHGADSNGALFQSFLAEQGGFESTADSANWIIVYPDGLMSLWEDGTDSAFIAALIDSICTVFHADSNKVCITGFSVGAARLYDLMGDLQGKIAAYAPVAGTMRLSTSQEMQAPLATNVMMFHTVDDNQFLYDGIPEWDFLGVNETFSTLCTRAGIDNHQISTIPDDKDGIFELVQNDDSQIALILDKTGGHYWKPSYAAEISNFFYTVMNQGYQLSVIGIENGSILMPDTKITLGILETFPSNSTIPTRNSVRFLSDNQEIAFCTSEPFSVQLPQLQPGLHFLSAEVSYSNASETYTRVSALNPSVLSIPAGVTGNCEIVPVIAAVASSRESPELDARYAVDRSTARRWSSAWRDNQFIELDLGCNRTICGCGLIWERAYAKEMNILVSTDRQQWNSVYENKDGHGNFEYAPFNPHEARYVKIQGITRATEYGFSLWEIIVIGQKNSLVIDAVTQQQEYKE